MDNIRKLQRWYNKQCNGSWEHQYGVSIDTLDNPGWTVVIDLVGTDLESMRMEPIVEEEMIQIGSIVELRTQDSLEMVVL